MAKLRQPKLPLTDLVTVLITFAAPSSSSSGNAVTVRLEMQEPLSTKDLRHLWQVEHLLNFLPHDRKVVIGIEEQKSDKPINESVTLPYHLYIWNHRMKFGTWERTRGKCIGNYTSYKALVFDAEFRTQQAGYPKSRWAYLFDWNQGAWS